MNNHQNQIIQDVYELGFVHERGEEQVYSNRKRLFDLVRKSFPELHISVWLKEKEQGYNYWSLSCTSFDEQILDANLYDTIVSEGPTDEDGQIIGFQDEKLFEDFWRKALKSNSDEPLVIHNGFINKLFRTPDVSTSFDRAIGILSVCYDVNGIGDVDKYLDIDSTMLNSISLVYAKLIEQGRMARVLRTSETLQKFLKREPTSIDVITEVAESLKQTCGASSFSIVQTANPNWAGTLSTDTEEDISLHKRTISRMTNKIECKRNNNLPFDEGIISSKSHKNYLYIPLVESGVELTSASLRPIQAFTGSFDEKPIISNFIILKNKKRELFHSHIFSSTDISICESSRPFLQTYLTNKRYEERMQAASKFFESLNKDKDISAELLYKKLNDGIKVTKSVSIIDFFISNDGELDHEIDCSNSNALPSSEYLGRIGTACTKHVKGNTNGFPEEVRIGVEHKGDSNAFIELHLSNKMMSSRVVLLEIDKALLTSTDLKIIKYFVTELHLFYKDFDAVQQRQALLVQVRHAIINAVSAAANSIIRVRGDISFGQNNPTAWNELKNDRSFYIAIDNIYYLVNQSRLISETGRYLFSEINSNELKADHFNPESLLNDLIGIFRKPMLDRRMHSFLSVEGSIPEAYQNFATGDSILLWIAISNLIDNGIKYARRSSKITIKLQYFSKTYRISITNEGEFLSEDVRNLIFQPYIRGRRVNNLNRKHGTGIGLPVSKKILEAHSDRSGLTYQSNKTENNTWATTTFEFTLPYRIGGANK